LAGDERLDKRGRRDAETCCLRFDARGDVLGKPDSVRTSRFFGHATGPPALQAAVNCLLALQNQGFFSVSRSWTPMSASTSRIGPLHNEIAGFPLSADLLLQAGLIGQ
jgi:hypothetical protein